MGTTTATQLISEAFNLRQSQKGTLQKTNQKCVLTGEQLQQGYLIFDIVAKSQGEWQDTFKGNPYGFMSESSARCWGASNPRHNTICSKSLAVIDNIGYEPLQSQKSANEQGRISWRKLIFLMCQNMGKTCVIIYSDDTKKRVWPRFADRLVGTIGDNTPILVYDTKQSGMYEIVRINIKQLKDQILFIEMLYDKGFYKSHVVNSLYQNSKAIVNIDIEKISEWENQLNSFRKTKQFQLALLFARGKKKGEFL